MVDLSDLRGEEFLTSGGVVMMAPRRRFELVYAPEMKKHLRVIECKYYGLIRREIVAQLQFEPSVETRNRKPLKRSVAFESSCNGS